MDATKVAARVQKMVSIKNEIISDGVEKVHVKLQGGNRKTGDTYHTVSLIPIADCQNCSGCKNECYDVRNDCCYPSVQFDRARNSAIHSEDFSRFWDEIRVLVKSEGVTDLRYNVGGDFTYNDFVEVRKTGLEYPKTSFLFFSKNYDDLNRFYEDYGGFPSNVRDMWSRWPNMAGDNINHIPEAHVLYADGSTTAPDGSYFCGGNCGHCKRTGEGCPHLKAGEHVVFKNH